MASNIVTASNGLYRCASVAQTHTSLQGQLQSVGLWHSSDAETGLYRHITAQAVRDLCHPCACLPGVTI